MINIDFSRIAGNPFYLATLGLSLIGWIITLAGSAAAAGSFGAVLIGGVVWFWIIFELFLILGIALAIATDSIRYYRLVILTFLGYSLTSIVFIANATINSVASEGQAVAAGSIFLSLVTIVWIFSFGSEEGSIISNSINSLAINKVDRNTHPLGYTPSGPISPGIQMLPTSVQEPVNSINNTVIVSPNAEYAYRAKALYDYQANPDDQNELSFVKGETLDIVDNKGKWWQAKKADGTVGIAPSNYLQIV